MSRHFRRPFPLVSPPFLNGAPATAMSAWLPWIAAAAVLIVLPVLLRVYVGEDGPDNAITQEQPGDGEQEREPGALRAAA